MVITRALSDDNDSWANTEELIPVKNREKLGIDAALRTVRTWYQAGLRKGTIKLQTTLRGGRRVTSRERVADFFRRLNGN